jgi:type I restriction enzyme S subunit
MESIQRGTSYPAVTDGDVKNSIISLPTSIQTQKQIVAKLDQCFEAIDKAKANAAKNLENAKELFQSKLNDIFSQKGEDWVEKKLGDVCEKTSNIKWADFQNDKFEYIDLSAVSRISLKVTKTTTVDTSNAPSRAKKIIKTNDIIFATTRPTLKRITIISNEYDNQICSTGYTVLRAIENLINYRFIYYFLQTNTFMNRMESIQRGTSYPAVTDGDVKNSIISLPTSIQTQKQIVKLLGNLREQTQSLESKYQQELNSLEELKKSILQKAFEGEL